MLFVGGRAELFQGIPVSIPGVTVGHIKRGHHDIGISSPATERDGLALVLLPGYQGGVGGIHKTAEGEKWLWGSSGKVDGLAGVQGFHGKRAGNVETQG